MKVTKKSRLLSFSPTILVTCLIVIIIVVGFVIIESGKNRSTQLGKDAAFEKDEYCRRTYADSLVKNYEKKLIGYKGNESETIKLVDIFFSPLKNQCFAVYDYTYINPTIYEGPNGEKDTLSMFERRVTSAISADNVIDIFQLTIGGGFENSGERERYEGLIKELKTN